MPVVSASHRELPQIGSTWSTGAIECSHHTANSQIHPEVMPDVRCLAAGSTSFHNLQKEIIVDSANLMTAKEFLDRRFELPESGQWSELEAGRVVHLQPPDLDHGTVVLNLSKAFAEHAQSTDAGYACFDLGLQLAAAPDTVRFPAACYFDSGPRFAESDREITSSIPALVVELASTSDRQRLQPQRSHEYLEWGVQVVWTIEPRLRLVSVFTSDQPVRSLGKTDSLTGESILGGFRVEVETLFAEPEWWTGGKRPGVPR